MRTFMFASLAAVAGLGVIIGTANAGEEPAKKVRPQCVALPVQDTRIVDDRTLVITDQNGNSATLKLSGPCLTDRNSVVQIVRKSNRTEVCDRDDVDVTGNLTSTPLACSVISVKLTGRR